MLQDCKELDAVFVTVGGGGLIGGVSAYLKHSNPNIQVCDTFSDKFNLVFLGVQLQFYKKDWATVYFIQL